MSKPEAGQQTKTSRIDIKKGLVYLAIGLIVVFFGYQYIKTTNPVNNAGQTVVDYIAAKKQFAEKLSDAISANLDKYRVLAIVGPQYRPGYVLDPDNPIDLLTNECLLDESLLDVTAMAPLPITEFQNSVTTDISASKRITQYAGEIANIGGQIKKSENGIYYLSDLVQKLAPQRQFYKALTREKCWQEIKGNEVMIVRGLILAKEFLGSSGAIGAKVNTKLIGQGSIVLNSYRKGAFSLVDKEPIPRFHIITLFKSGTKRGKITKKMFTKPDASQIEAIYQKSQ